MNRRSFLSTLGIAALSLPALVKAATPRRLGPLQTKVCQNVILERVPTGPYAGIMTIEEVWRVGPYHRFGFIEAREGRQVVTIKIDRLTERGPVEVHEMDMESSIPRMSVSEICDHSHAPRFIAEPPTITVSWREMEDVT